MASMDVVSGMAALTVSPTIESRFVIRDGVVQGPESTTVLSDEKHAQIREPLFKYLVIEKKRKFTVEEYKSGLARIAKGYCVGCVDGKCPLATQTDFESICACLVYHNNLRTIQAHVNSYEACDMLSQLAPVFYTVTNVEAHAVIVLAMMLSRKCGCVHCDHRVPVAVEPQMITQTLLMLVRKHSTQSAINETSMNRVFELLRTLRFTCGDDEPLFFGPLTTDYIEAKFGEKSTFADGYGRVLGTKRKKVL